MRNSINNNAVESTQDGNIVTSSGSINCQDQTTELITPNTGSQQIVPKDDERDLIELMIASSTIPSSNAKSKSEKSSANSSGINRGDAKKRVKLQRDVARDLSLLLPDSDVAQEEKAFSFAQAYYLKVKDKLDDQSFSQFTSILNNFDTKDVKVSVLYHDIMPILKAHPDLSEEFLAFLLPHQAMELGVYMDYLYITKIRSFLRKLEVYFGKQPQQMRKVYESLTRLADQSAVERVDQDALRSVILPLLKGSSLLTEYFLQLFPCEQPPIIECSDNKDFEKVGCNEFDECGRHVRDIDDDWETVEIPDVEDPFGGDSCPCICHNSVSSSVSSHCFSCGIKFINGRVFVQSGKVLRPAQLVVEGTNKKEIIDRIAKKPTDVKDYDEKGPVRQRKRPATDNSPNKGGSVGGTNSGVHNTGPNEAEEDVSDPKPPSAKVKSPRAVKGIKIMKTNSNKDTTNKDKNLIEKDKNSIHQTEDDGLIFDSFVLLDDLKTNNVLKEKASESNVNEEGTTTSKCQDDDEDYTKSKDNVLVPSSSSQSSNEVNLIRDDEDDDIEYIDIDDDDDEVDDECDDIEEDDPHNDDEGEEEEEEYDDDDIEEVDIDEEFDREMDVDDVQEITDACDKTSNVDKQTSRDTAKSSCISKVTSVKIKEEPNVKMCNADGKHTIKDQSKIVSEVKFPIRIKEEPNETENYSPLPPILIDKIKMEIINDEYHSESKYISPELTTPLVSNDRTLESKTVDRIVTPTPSPVIVISSTEDNLNSKVNDPASVDSSKVSENTAVNTPSTSSVSWTKEEDKIILQTFQQENDTDQTFITIRERLPQRSVEEIKSRFHILMLLLKRMTTNKNIE